MDRVVSHVVRRGMEAHTAMKEKAPVSETINISNTGVGVLFGTFFGFILLSFMISYTYGNLIPALAMVESPIARVFEPVPTEELSDDSLAEKNDPVDELVLVRQKPITSKFRTTVKHLRSIGGRRATFRGFAIYAVYNIVLAELSLSLSMAGVPQAASAILAALTLGRINMAWTHIVMSEPSSKYWYQRLPSFASYRKVVVPTLIAALAEEAAYGLPVFFFYALDLNEINGTMFSDMSCATRKLMALKFAVIIFLGFFTSVALVVPAHVALTRVQASMLPETDETIVPFDRTFGGHLGADGTLSQLEAWKTFNWSSRLTLLKCYVKVAAMQVATVLLAMVVIVAEVRLFLGPEDFQKLENYANLWLSH